MDRGDPWLGCPFDPVDHVRKVWLLRGLAEFAHVCARCFPIRNRLWVAECHADVFQNAHGRFVNSDHLFFVHDFGQGQFPL